MSTYNNDMVAHVWAQQNEDSGKNGNGCFYFTGSTIYSYNETFPIANFVKNDVVLFTTDSYSTTTSQHCSKVRQALNSWITIFNVPNVKIVIGTKHNYTKQQNKENHAENIQAYKKLINKTVLQASRARSNKEWLNGQAIDLVDECNLYIETFKLRNKKIELPNSEQILIDAQKAKKAKIRKDKATAKKIAIANKQKIIDWCNGDLISLPYSIDTMIRIRGNNIETSKNATFPIKHALLALKIIKRCKENKTEFKANGKTINLGHFNIDLITIEGDVTAGCHFVKYDQIIRIESELINWKEGA